VLAGPAIVLRFNIDPHGVGLDIRERFHILPTLLVAVPVSAVLSSVCARVTRPSRARSEGRGFATVRGLLEPGGLVQAGTSLTFRPGTSLTLLDEKILTGSRPAFGHCGLSALSGFRTIDLIP
jgi:hypothetical protein